MLFIFIKLSLIELTYTILKSLMYSLRSVREGKSITKIDLIPSTIASDSKLQNKNEDSSSDVIINVTTTDEEENSSNTDL